MTRWFIDTEFRGGEMTQREAAEALAWYEIRLSFEFATACQGIRRQHRWWLAFWVIWFFVELAYVTWAAISADWFMVLGGLLGLHIVTFGIARTWHFLGDVADWRSTAMRAVDEASGQLERVMGRV